MVGPVKHLTLISQFWWCVTSLIHAVSPYAFTVAQLAVGAEVLNSGVRKPEHSICNFQQYRDFQGRQHTHLLHGEKKTERGAA